MNCTQCMMCAYVSTHVVQTNTITSTSIGTHTHTHTNTHTQERERKKISICCTLVAHVTMAHGRKVPGWNDLRHFSLFEILLNLSVQ